MTAPLYLQLDESDNVVVLATHFEPGAVLQAPDGSTWAIGIHLEPGNKLALRPIAAGEAVVKYGFTIGTATDDIPAGAHVHTHNLQSIHIPLKQEEASS